MSQTLTKPTLASELNDAWYERVQEAIRVGNARVRANPSAPTIQVWSDNNSAWQDLKLPTGTELFGSYDDRNLVYRRLVAK